jgi:hypothetical protein
VEAEREAGHPGGRVARGLPQRVDSGGGLRLRGLPAACVPPGNAMEPGHDEPVMAACVNDLDPSCDESYESAGDQRLLYVAGGYGGGAARRWRVPGRPGGRLLDPARRDAGARAARAVRVAVHRRRRRLLPAPGRSAQRRGVNERPSVRDRPRSRRRGRHRGSAAADPRRRRGGVRLPRRCRPGTSGLPAAAGRLARCGPRPGPPARR